MEDRGKALEIATYDRPADTQYAVVHNVMVPMRDGVKLATDLYFPASPDGQILPGPFPVILDRTPYEKIPRAVAANEPEHFARRGYVFVFQDARGHGESEGEFFLYVNEGNDGYDCMEWIAAQPWCNGQIGTSGYSHDAATQNAIARAGSPHLKSMFPAFSSSNYHNDVAGHGGAYRLSHNFVYTVLHAHLDKRARAKGRSEASPEERSFSEALGAWTSATGHPSDPGHVSDIGASLHKIQQNMFEWLTVHPEQHYRVFRDVPNAEQWYHEWMDHPDEDDYWRQNAYYFEGFYDDFTDATALHMGGYYDMCTPGSIANFEGLRARKKSPQYLLLGPWCHGPMNARRTYSGEVDFGTISAVDWNHVRLALFDETLKDTKTAMFNKDDTVRAFIMGGGSGRKNAAGRLEHGGYWVSSSEWPLRGTVTEEYFLTPSRGLTTGTTEEGSRSYIYDPADPLIQIGGDYTWPGHMGARNQVQDPSILGTTGNLPLAARSDVVTFETESLREDLVVAGHVFVELFVSSDCPDTDFTAKLIDQYPVSKDYPDGFAMLLTDSIIRLRYRETREHAVDYTPGEVVKVEIDVHVIANLFKAGHRIRLDISSGNFPSYDPNPNTGEPIAKHTHLRKANNTIYFGGDHASKLILPVVKN